MTPEQYAVRQAVISAAAAAFAYQFAQFWAQAALTLSEWVRLLNFIWPEVERRRDESAALAREFYDSQRSDAAPELPRNDVDLESSDFKVFVQAMEPVRKRMQQADSPRDAVTMLSLQVVREVENAGRRQIIHAVEQDEVLVKNLRNTKKEISGQIRTGLVRGWARVATGRETCGWCLMLISRGPVYYEADTAGLKIDDDTAKALIAAGEDVSEYMQDWHTGCDCKVIPVFKKDDWENSPYGRAAARAKDLWDDATEEAEKLLDSRGTRIHTTGKKKGEEFTKNEEVILALRRRLYAGDINPSEFAGLAA